MKTSLHRSFSGCVVALTLAGCALRPSPPYEAAAPITDGAYLQAEHWNDGQAEVAFYQVERDRNQYGEAADQAFLVGTYLVKHDFDRARQSKATPDAADPVSAFKYALFYEFESGSYEYKRNYVVNATQADLMPLKHSFTGFDWCSNLYREMAFQPDGTVEAFMRSDDYGNRAEAFAYRPHAYTFAQVPLLVRGLDFSEAAVHSFSVVLPDGRFVRAEAEREGAETLESPDGPVETERIRIRYDGAVPSLIGEEADEVERYWRGTDPARLLHRLEAASGRYRMTLVEQVRSPYWSENLYPRLTRVDRRP